jgi:hypothetical protein
LCNLYSITTNQAAIIALFRVINRYVGNLPPMPGVLPLSCPGGPRHRHWAQIGERAVATFGDQSL